MSTIIMQHPKQQIAQPFHHAEKLERQLIFGPQAHGSLRMRQPVMKWLRSKSEWCYAVVDLFELKPSTAEIAITILSRYTQCHQSPDCLPSSDHHFFRCTGAASLAIAIRVNNERYPVSYEDLVRMGESRFTEEEIMEGENDILQSLNHCVSSPTIELFAKQYIKFLELKHNISLRHLRQTTLEPLLQTSIRDLLFLEFPVEFVALVVVSLALDLCPDTSEQGYSAELYTSAGVTKDSADDHAIRALSNELLELHLETLK